MNYDDMFDELDSSSSSNEKSELMLKLSSDLQSDIREFLNWLKTSTSFKNSTVSSYKTYICKYFLIKLEITDDEMTRDYKSAAKKFKFWLEHVKLDED